MDNHFSFQLYKKYSSYYEQKLKGRYITADDIHPLIEKLKDNERFKIGIVGRSVKGRPIHLVQWGKGLCKIFMWSQMHGNESTATRAIFDLLNFLKAGGEFDDFRIKLFNTLSIFIIPMVNPDGAELFTRENELGIDLNRDARKKEAPESQCLFQTMEKINPEFGFNLHDQSNKYSAGDSGETATISLLAPAFNKENDLNKIREKAMQLVIRIENGLSKIISGKVGRYDDEFEPRSFGDQFQAKGVSTILIEAGGTRGDPEREEVRKIYFYTLLKGIESIAQKSYSTADVEEYFKIPVNHEIIFDLLIKNISVENNGMIFNIDIGIDREVIGLRQKKFIYKGIIKEIGDLDGYYGYEEIDGKEMLLQPGRLYPQTITNIDSIDYFSLLKEGFSHVHMKEVPSQKGIDAPVNILKSGNIFVNNVKPDHYANFFLKKDRNIKLGVINGFLVDPNGDLDKNLNGLIL